jgi:IS1 family transposase
MSEILEILFQNLRREIERVEGDNLPLREAYSRLKREVELITVED